MLEAREIQEMSAVERIEVMELLWESISKDGIDCSSPAGHATVLRQRSGIIDSDGARWLSINELQARLMQ